jgi:hypothetical protein
MELYFNMKFIQYTHGIYFSIRFLDLYRTSTYLLVRNALRYTEKVVKLAIVSGRLGV